MTYLGKIVDVEWSDAFDDSETHPDDLTREYRWHTYGRVIRDTAKLITIATSEGGKGRDAQVFATSILKPMVLKVTVLDG